MYALSFHRHIEIWVHFSRLITQIIVFSCAHQMSLQISVRICFCGLLMGHFSVVEFSSLNALSFSPWTRFLKVHVVCYIISSFIVPPKEFISDILRGKLYFFGAEWIDLRVNRPSRTVLALNWTVWSFQLLMFSTSAHFELHSHFYMHHYICCLF